MSYFSNNDFDVFKSENIIRNESDVRQARKVIKGKLLDINEDINERMNSMGLYHHKDTAHITSLLIPCEFNHGRVNWIGIRYGKHPSEIDKLNMGVENKYDIYGFQKHSCFQLDVCLEGIEMGIFHAVPKGSVDRMYCHQMIEKDDVEFKKRLIEAVNGIVGYGFVWNVGVDGLSMDGFEGDSFDFDGENVSDGESRESVGEKFIKWYSDVDKEGRYSSLLYRFGRDDERISSVEGIEEEFFKVVEKLRELYECMVWRGRE